MIWVIDTSALVRLFVPDGPLHPEVEPALNRASHGADVVLAPHLMQVEVANVMLRKHRRGEFSATELRELLAAVASLPIRYCDHAAVLQPACDLALAHDLTAYDALYLALAEQHRARLLTCDETLQKAAVKVGVS